MAFRTKKISQMDPKGSNLASTDLLEISQLVSGSYVTKSITGAEIISGATTGFVPTTRTLTINGTTQDLSANRTFTVSTGITIGTTAITSGTVGRVLFEGTGNVVQESANLFWDNTNGRLGIGTSSPAFRLEVQGGDVRFANGLTIGTAGSAGWQFSSNTVTLIQNGFLGVDVANGRTFGITNMAFSTFYFRIAETTGNVLINTTTDAGFKLDVNGTARVSGNIQADSYIKFATGWIRGASNQFLVYDSGLNVKASIHLASGTSYFNTGGNFVFGSASANASAIVQADSTTQGFLPPRMTTTQKNAIASPATGLMVYDTTLNLISVYNGTIWISL